MEISIGKVIKTKGLDGSILVNFFSEKLVCKKGDFLFFEKQNEKFGPYKTISNQFYKFCNNQKIYILKLEEITSIEKARILKTSYLVKNYDILPEGIFTKSNLINAKIILRNTDAVFGKIIDVVRVKSSYCLILVEPFYNKEEIFIPFIKEVISSVDVAKKVVYVNLVEGITDFL